MNRQELINAASLECELDSKQIGVALDAILKAIVECVASGDKVTLVGFGSLEARKYKARPIHKIKTGELIQVPARTLPRFSPGKQFREAVGRSETDCPETVDDYAGEDVMDRFIDPEEYNNVDERYQKYLPGAERYPHP